jgi:hypothetical protein
MSPFVGTRPNPLVPTGAVGVIDRTLGRMLTDVCAIQQPASGRSASGALVSGQHGTVAIVSCQVVTPGRTATERITGPRFGVEADYEVKVPRDTPVPSSGRIVVNGTRMLEIVYAAEATFGFLRSILVKVPSGEGVHS